MSAVGGKLAIIGWPVGHSRSPLIHNYWLALRGEKPLYEAYPVDPSTDFRAALEGMAQAGFVGANVTVPHKEAAFAAMDVLSARAEKLGAVNTISFENGRLHGANTDGDGFVASLDEAAGAANCEDWRRQPALVLGAGGAARAIIAALGAAGLADIRLVNRTRDKAEALCGLANNLQIGDWVARTSLAEGCGLLVNTTSLGMVGQPSLDMPDTALRALAPRALVCDIVYAPLETPLLAAARAAGHIGVDGLGMLLHQAALSFEIWHGARPQIDAALRDKLIADLVREA
jgi:shikimate dehydrogenase